MAPEPILSEAVSMTANTKRTEHAIHLYLRGGDLEPQTVAAVFDVALHAEHHKAGDAFLVNGELVARADGFCVITSSLAVQKSASFEVHVEWFLERVEPHLEKIKEWQATGWDLQIDIITVTNRRSGGPRVDPETLKRIANLGLVTRWVTGFQE